MIIIVYIDKVVFLTGFWPVTTLLDLIEVLWSDGDTW